MPSIIPTYYTPDNQSDPNTLHAVLEVSRSGPGVDAAVSIGAAVSGGSKLFGVWMAGYAAYDDLLRAAMVRYLLQHHRPEGFRLAVYTKGLKDRLRHVSLSTGLRADKRSRFIGFDVLKPVQMAHDRGDWLLQGVPSHGYGLQAARAVASDGMAAAERERFGFPALRQERPDWHVVAVGPAEDQLDVRR